MDFGSFFTFRRLLAPYLIRIIYILGFLAVTFSVLALLGQAPVTGIDGGTWLRLGLLFLGGQILWRVICEGFIVAFAVYERLGEILAELRRLS